MKFVPGKDQTIVSGNNHLVHLPSGGDNGSTLALQLKQDLYESSINTATICAKLTDLCGRSITAMSSISVIVKLLFGIDKYFLEFYFSKKYVN